MLANNCIMPLSDIHNLGTCVNKILLAGIKYNTQEWWVTPGYKILLVGRYIKYYSWVQGTTSGNIIAIVMAPESFHTNYSCASDYTVRSKLAWRYREMSPYFRALWNSHTHATSPASRAIEKKMLVSSASSSDGAAYSFTWPASITNTLKQEAETQLFNVGIVYIQHHKKHNKWWTVCDATWSYWTPQLPILH